MNLCDIGFKVEFKEDDVVNFNSCSKLYNCYGSHLEVLYRDSDVFNRSVSQMPYALVLLDEENNYCGHIYVWIYENNIYCMGIRNNVKSLFSKSKLKNVSTYLLEGVRRFALHFGFNDFNMMMPVSKMKFILENKFHFALVSFRFLHCIKAQAFACLIKVVAF